MRPLRSLAALAAAALAAPALAHQGTPGPEGHFGWTWDPAITLPLILAAILFATGWVRLNARVNRGTDRLRRYGLFFAAGWIVLAGALVSPLHQGGEHSFTLHMTEHELMMLLAAPLLVLGRPLTIMLWAFPPTMRQRLGRVGTSRSIAAMWTTVSAPVAATLLQAAALWLWHAPALFDLALASEGWHAAQHLSFLASALLFWTAMLGHHHEREAGASAVAVLCLFATSVVSGALGALMALSNSPWYVAYARMGMAPLGLSPAEDQQVAGLLMWVPGGLVHAGAALVLMRSLLGARPGGEVAHAR